MKKLLTLPLIIALSLTGCANKNNAYPKLAISESYTKTRNINNFSDYVEFLKSKAAGAGVSKKTLNSQNVINYNARAIQLDRQQAGRKRDPNARPNPNGVTNYLNKVLNQKKVNTAAEYWYEHKAKLSKVSQKYGVQKEYILALWGMESSFGRHQGSFDVLSVLATLAFEGRREKLFTQEFVNAMKMLDKGMINREQMLGSWAGAMGQTQFMPTAYLKYAADGNGDGKKDIWNNEYDAFASIANYLFNVGWDDRKPWGVEVRITKPIDMSFSGIEDNKARTLGEWQTWGVQVAYPTAQETAKLAALKHGKLWLIRPDREAGRAFLVSNNFRTLMHWNRSNNFGISIGKFADRILATVEGQ